MSTHYGQSLFFLTIFKTSSNPKLFPKWHSLYHQVPNSFTFNVLLNQYKITYSSMVSYFLIYLIIQSIFICQFFNYFYFSRKVILNIRMFQAACIILWKSKGGLIWIWKTLENATLFTGERQLKLELDENIFVKHNLLNLTWKLSSNSLIQQLTMFYFDHIY